MKPSLFKHPPTLWLSIGAAVLLALLLAAGGFAASVYGQATRQLADIEPRHARLAGLLQNKELLTQAESALDANSSQFIGAASEDPIQLGNTALQRVRDLATARYNVLVGTLRLKQAAGTLTADDVAAVDTLLAR